MSKAKKNTKKENLISGYIKIHPNMLKPFPVDKRLWIWEMRAKEGR